MATKRPGFQPRFPLVCLIVLLLLPAVRARADEFSGYQPAGSFSFPSAPSSFDVLPDGRIIAIIGQDLFRESSAGSRSFVDLGPLPNADIPGFGAAFLRVSPDGTRVAVGNNGGSSGNFAIGIFTLAPLAGQWFSANHFDAAWIDGRSLAVAAGAFGSPSVVTVLDTQSASTSNPSNPTLISNIGGASAGVAVDAAGNLYTGNGFQGNGPSTTGSIYAFPHATWVAALMSGVPLNFETQGIPIADLLSASPLGFDAEGNLFVGGGDFFGSSGDLGYFALVRANAVSAALGGLGPVNTTDPTKVMKLDPDPAAGDFYSFVANRPRSELYALNFADTTAYVYKAPASVPSMTTSGMLVLASLLLALGVIAQSRRRSLTRPRG